MRSAAMLCLSFTLAACGQLGGGGPELEDCENRILENMANADSYVRGEYTSLALDDRWQVGIEYSYSDSQGRKVTDGWQTCEYPIAGGKPDTSQLLSAEGSHK